MIQRKKSLKRSQNPIPKRRKDPAKRRWAKHRCQPYLDWLKQEACAVSGLVTGEGFYDTKLGGYSTATVDPAHTRPRSLGADDLYECLPLARHLHEEQERIGWPRFEAKYGIDRKGLAREYADRFLADHPEHDPEGGACQ